jgi:hypothetical protein
VGGHQAGQYAQAGGYGGGSINGRPASYAAPPSGPYGAMPQPPLPPQQPQPGSYFAQVPLPPQQQHQPQSYLNPSPASTNGSFVQRPPRAASMQPGDFAALQQGMDGMNLNGPPGGYLTGGGARPNYYANPEDGPPHKLSVVHPDVRPHLFSLFLLRSRTDCHFDSHSLCPLTINSKTCSAQCAKPPFRTAATSLEKSPGRSKS